MLDGSTHTPVLMSRLLLLAAFLLASTAADAQVREGLIELGGTASLSSVDGGDDRVTVLQLAPEVGYFFTDRLEAGVALGYTKLFVDGNDPDGQGDLAVFGEYHFGQRGATTVPFLGVRLGTSITSDSDLIFGGSGGAKFFFLPGGALTGEVVLVTDGDALNVGLQGGVSIFF